MDLDKRINKPSHYQTESGLEVIDVIYLFGHHKNPNRANVLKYALRAGYKGPAKQDLQKAIDYLNFEINEIELMENAKAKAEAIVECLKKNEAYYGRIRNLKKYLINSNKLDAGKSGRNTQ